MFESDRGLNSLTMTLNSLESRSGPQATISVFLSFTQLLYSSDYFILLILFLPGDIRQSFVMYES